MSKINWFAVMIICIWICAALGSKWTKDTTPFGAAAFVTFCAGLGYLILHGK